MKSISVLYQGEENINYLIEQGELYGDLPYFIQIVTSGEEPKESLKIACYIQEKFPNANVMGFSASGLIYKGEQYAEGVLILFRIFDKTQIFQTYISWEGKSASTVAKEVNDAIVDKSPSLMHVICGGYYYDVHDFVEEFNKRNDYTAMVGGVASGARSDDVLGFVFTPEGVYEKGLIIVALYGSEISFHTSVNTSLEPIGGKHILTKTENGSWKEVDGQQINQWLFEQLGLEKLESYSDWEAMCANDILVHFPMILEEFHSASRFLRYDLASDSIIQYYSRVPEGTRFRIGYLNPNQCLQENFRICNEIMNQPVEELFCYTCLFRRLYLKSSSDWEITPYKNAGICGAFMMGEFSYVDGHNELLNGSSCFVSVAENETYIRPNIKVFDKLSAIGEDTTNLLNMVLKRQQETTSKKNEELIKTLISQQKKQENQIYYEINSGAPNYLKYKEDLKTNYFDKFCILKIENAELLITHLGHAAYLKIMCTVLAHVEAILKELREQEHAIMQLYLFNETIFFIAADERMSESHFMRICKNVHKDNHLLHLENEEIVVTRFVVCLHQKNPIEAAMNTLAASKNMQNSFLVCEKEDDSFSSDVEFKMIGVLNRAFEKDGIIPYFQGIYDNKKKCIDYYEALMRIIDGDGTLYAPGQFIEIAKKYHMYTELSRKMINKVFELFSNKDKVVSLNISVYDIQSTDTKEMIYLWLKECKKPSNFVFEILEDEAYRDFEPLKNFISKVSELGAKVAIDDFGAGYSNLYEISNISFDIIKVDGSIIRNLSSNECNRKLLNVITHMGLLFDAKIVAEFVENQVIQDVIEETGIDFSQGYLFAKPLPFGELKI